MEKLDVMQIGKNGITDSSMKDILERLKEKKKLKVKFLKNFLAETDRKQAYEALKKKLPADISSKLVGSVVFLEKK